MYTTTITATGETFTTETIEWARIGQAVGLTAEEARESGHWHHGMFRGGEDEATAFEVHDLDQLTAPSSTGIL
jgi:hypothetical protein